MERIRDYKFSTLIEAGYSYLPDSIADRLRHVHFLCGVDPVYTGLHDDKGTCPDGRLWREMSHTSYAYGQLSLPRDKRHTTVVLPRSIETYSPVSVVHELAHCLDEVEGFYERIGSVTEYAKTNSGEAFAEAFCSWLFRDYGDYSPDYGTLVLFRSFLTDKELRKLVHL